MLKGAASSGTPKTLCVEVAGRTISKNALLYHYEKVCGNKYIRRLAEFLAIPIGEFAQAKILDGELAQRIDTKLVGDGKTRLNPVERSWCRYFSQSIDSNTLAKKSSERLCPMSQ